MAPGLLTMAQVQRLKGLFRRLVAGETGPFVMASGRAQFSQPPIGFRLMKPVRRTVHTRAATTVPRASRRLRTTATMASSSLRRLMAEPTPTPAAPAA